MMTNATATLRAAARGTIARGVTATLGPSVPPSIAESSSSQDSAPRNPTPAPATSTSGTAIGSSDSAKLPLKGLAHDPAPWHNYNIRYDQHGREIPNLTPGALSLAHIPVPAEPEEPASWFEPATPLEPIRRKGTFGRGHWVKRAR